MRRTVFTLLSACLLLVGCERGGREEDTGRPAAAPRVTVSADQMVSAVPPWTPVALEVTPDNRDALHAQAAAALEAGRLHGGADGDDAATLYLGLVRADTADVRAALGLLRTAQALVAAGDAALARIDGDDVAWIEAHRIAAVARVLAAQRIAGNGRNRRLQRMLNDYLARVDRADEGLRQNLAGEAELAADRVGELGGGALAHFRAALALRASDARALQGLAAVESALIRRAEQAAQRDDYDTAAYWLDTAGNIRPGNPTVGDARARIADTRAARVRALRDAGIAALPRQPRGLHEARTALAELLRIAPPGDPAAVELRERIALATHYGLFRPGQVFTDAFPSGARGPALVVVPHGAFRMGAPEDEADSSDAERPQHEVRFTRGFAMSRNEVTVGEFRRFVEASGHRPRSSRRGYSHAYDERSGNFVRRGYVDFTRDYAGMPAADTLPVVHVSAKDAQAYAEWLSAQTGHSYRLPSEAEFEYALRAGTQTRFPWTTPSVPPRVGNLTGALDSSPRGRRWQNAFAGYGDGAWGPAPVGSYRPNRYGLHDLAGNVSEWVDDCWHASYRRAPADGRAWINPGCRTRVVRGGSWASSPAQTRSAWRQGQDADTTNGRIGFRVVREI